MSLFHNLFQDIDGSDTATKILSFFKQLICFSNRNCQFLYKFVIKVTTVI